MIPKIIHYCWFGGNEKSDLIEFCISSWKKFLTDYQIVEWNESNFDINCCNYVTDAYNNKKWAHVSDYVRAYALYNFGGIYLDTDVEIRSNLDEFLKHRAFSGFETKGYPFTALWGAEIRHEWPLRVIEYYNNSKFTLKTNTISISEMLVKEYGANPYLDKLQILSSGIHIYPSNYFCLDIPNFATHHFEGSWLNEKEGTNYKYYVNMRFFEDKFFENHNIYDAINLYIDNSKINGFKLIKLLIKIYYRFMLNYLKK
jgi:hypothetical protein